MGNNKDPAVLFYTSDFLSGCALMDMRERGQYITLLCLQRERGHMTMQEIVRAVKKPSTEVMRKFQKDDDGKYYNRRMDLEIEKREAHCQRQRENVAKRWNKQNKPSGIGDGNSSGNTTVLPLGNGNGNGNGNIKDNSSISEEKKKGKEFTAPTLEEVEAYAEERGVPDLGKTFFEYFTAGEWCDSTGKPVQSWKQKFLTWESNEKKRRVKNESRSYVEHGDEMGEFERQAMKKMLERGMPDD
jgi:hypothetical protein